MLEISTAPGPRRDITLVYRGDLPVGHVTRVKHKGKTRYSAFVYCVPAPFDWFGGAHETLDAAVDLIGREGETPEYKRTDKRFRKAGK